MSAYTFLCFNDLQNVQNLFLSDIYNITLRNLIKISPFISLSVCFCRSWKDLTQPRSRHVVLNIFYWYHQKD